MILGDVLKLGEYYTICEKNTIMMIVGVKI